MDMMDSDHDVLNLIRLSGFGARGPVGRARVTCHSGSPAPRLVLAAGERQLVGPNENGTPF